MTERPAHVCAGDCDPQGAWCACPDCGCVLTTAGGCPACAERATLKAAARHGSAYAAVALTHRRTT